MVPVDLLRVVKNLGKCCHKFTQCVKIAVFAKRNKTKSVCTKNALSVYLKRLQFSHLQKAESEVSQKEKNKYCVLTHIYGIKKNDTDEPVCWQEQR